MTMNMIRGESRVPLEPLLDRTVAVIGFGNQGAAHALNLRDSGVDVRVGNRRETSSGRRALDAGFEPMPIPEAIDGSDLVILALPDELHAAIYAEQIAPHLKDSSTIGLLHGFSVHYGHLTPQADHGVILIAPKGPGTTLRQRFEQGLGIPCLMAIEQDNPAGDARALALAWARGIGCARAAIIETTFAHETETDLFGEQAVLCGGMSSLILAAFETLVDAGYPPELAYLECCHEVKQVADLVYEDGLAEMMTRISNTAEFGAYEAGPRIVSDSVRETMREILADIQRGGFAERLRKDQQLGFPWFEQQRETLRAHPIEPAGRVVRDMMPQRPA